MPQIENPDEDIEEKSSFVSFDGTKIQTLKCVIFCIQSLYVIRPKALSLLFGGPSPMRRMGCCHLPFHKMSVYLKHLL